MTAIVLAAGAGTRYGGPKALARTPEREPWLTLALTTLESAGIARRIVVLGAGADAARPLVPATAEVLLSADWSSGMGASLATALRAVPGGDAALVTLVDLPGLPSDVVRRVAGERRSRGVLRRATYGGRPGHPVLIGSAHVGALLAALAGASDDHGGRAYLAAHGAERVECGDLWHGRDIDAAPPA